MKKLFTYLFVVIMMIVAGCSESFDDSRIWDKLNDHENRIVKLEELCKQMNTNISSLHTIVNVLQSNDYVTSVKPILDDGKTIGYTIEFAKSQSITIYHSHFGTDVYTHIIGVRLDDNGIYYWTIDGEWLLDESGNKMKVQGDNGEDSKIPLLKIENDYWLISYDNGAIWTVLGKVKYEDGNNANLFFKEVTYDEQFVYITLTDGTIITISKGNTLDITFAECDLDAMFPNTTREIQYTVQSITDLVVVEVISSADIKAKAVADNANGLTGKIYITTGDAIDEYSKVIVFVSNGDKVIMRSFSFEEPCLVVEDNTTKNVDAKGGEVELEFLSNLECEVVVPEDAQSWISVIPNTRVLEKQSITLRIESNEGAARSAEVQVRSVYGKLSLTYNITQYYSKDYQPVVEREALISIYNALDGDNWTDNTNWCSDKPVSEWYGVSVHSDGTVRLLQLESNGLVGHIPQELYCMNSLELLNLCNNEILSLPKGISALKNLNSLQLPSIPEIPLDEILGLRNIVEIVLDLTNNDLKGVRITFDQWENLFQLAIRVNKSDCVELPQDYSIFRQLHHMNLSGFSGTISPTIGNCTKLHSLYITNGMVAGKIPSTIGQLQNLYDLNLSNNQLESSIPNEICNLSLQAINLSNNNLEGSLPDDFIELFDHINTNGYFPIDLRYNKFSGDISMKIQQHPKWSAIWNGILMDNLYDINNFEIPGPHITGCDIDGVAIDTDVDYAKHDYTILWQIAPEIAAYPNMLFNVYDMTDVYEKYKNKNIQFLYFADEWNKDEEILLFRVKYNLPYRVFSVNDYSSNIAYIEGLRKTFFWMYDRPSGNQVNVIDKRGKAVYISQKDGDFYTFLDKTLGE